MSPNSEPILAIMDCAGVPALSTACATAFVAVFVAPVMKASQNKNITTVIPTEDQSAICLRVPSGFALKPAM